MSPTQRVIVTTPPSVSPPPDPPTDPLPDPPPAPPPDPPPPQVVYLQLPDSQTSRGPISCQIISKMLPTKVFTAQAYR